jgi:hypothetical protein
VYHRCRPCQMQYQEKQIQAPGLLQRRRSGSLLRSMSSGKYDETLLLAAITRIHPKRDLARTPQGNRERTASLADRIYWLAIDPALVLLPSSSATLLRKSFSARDLEETGPVLPGMLSMLIFPVRFPSDFVSMSATVLKSCASLAATLHSLQSSLSLHRLQVQTYTTSFSS